MTDVIEFVEGSTTYHIYGLRTRGWELTTLATQLLQQLDVRCHGATRALAHFEGPIAHEFHQQAELVHGALAVLCRTVQEAGSICVNFPGPGHATYPDVPALPLPSSTSSFSAEPVQLRSLARSTESWDSVVRTAGHAVDLHGVTATATVERFVPGADGGAPELIIEGPAPIDPAQLVTLPNAANITARTLALSSATAELAELTATAVDQADSAFGIVSWIRLNAFVLGLKRSRGVSPADYAEHLRDYWLARAYETSGIDPADWDPTLGATANRHNIEAVYLYYGNLFLENPELQWAGMANMIGPSFAAGFLDLAMFRDLADATTGPSWLPRPFYDVPGVPAPPFERLGDLTAEEIRFYETTMLQMQKDIFIDAAVMHEAYLAGGMPAIRELGRAGIIDPRTVNAWSLIKRGSASGNDRQVADGNMLLLDREQNSIINDSYERMYNRYPSGPAVTYAITLIGQPSIPGAQGFADVYPLKATVPVTPGEINFSTPDRIGTPESFFGHDIPSIGFGIPSAEVTVPELDLIIETPLPDGNIAQQADRWRLIQEDTLPAYQQLLDEDPARVREIVASPIGDRIDDHRLVRLMPGIIDHVMTDWDMYIEADD